MSGPDPFFSARAGQPASISAEAVNSLFRMARPVVGSSPPPPLRPTLPALSAVLDTSALETALGRPVQFGEAVGLRPGGAVAAAVSAAVPIPDPWDPGGDEARVPQAHRLVACGAFAAANGLRPAVTDPIAVCSDAMAKRFTVAGMALVRVRVHSGHHRFARHPVRRPVDTDQQWADLRGFLDSAFAGPARIIAYVRIVSPLDPTLVDPGSVTLVYPATAVLWAVVAL